MEEQDDVIGPLFFTFVTQVALLHTMQCFECGLEIYIGFPYCTLHLAQILKLTIGLSTLGHGFGLFAFGKRNQVVFPPGSLICGYIGEVISCAQTSTRYGDNPYDTAKYAVKDNYGTITDAALLRGAASLANHARDPRANAVLEDRRRRDPRDCTVMLRAFGGCRVMLRAFRPILAGDEIFVDYCAGGDSTAPQAFSFNGAREQRTFPSSISPATVSDKDQRNWQIRWVAQQLQYLPKA